MRIANSAQIGGDAVVAGGVGRIGGQIGGDLYAGMGAITLAAHVGGNARIDAGDIQISQESRIDGTLHYSNEQPIDLPEGVARDVEFDRIVREVTQVSLATRVLNWILRTALILVGFVLFGWLVLRFAPAAIRQPVAAIQANPVETGLYGLIGAVLFIFVPIASAIMVFLVVLFWGAFPGIVMFLFLFTAFSLVWLFSPLVTGLWLGQQIAGKMSGISGHLPAFLIGMVILVILGRIPCLGWIIYLLSFVLALGGLIQARRDPGNYGRAALPEPEPTPAAAA